MMNADAAQDAHHAERGDERRQPDADDQPGRQQAGERRRPASPTDAPAQSGQPASTNRYPVTTVVSAMTAPGARSMPPEMMTIAAPIAAMP